MNYDLAIIGAGPGGYVAAIRARQLGMRVVLIEKDKAGGVCLNWGCIPTKSLIHRAHVFSQLKSTEAWGVRVDTSAFSYQHVHTESRNAAATLSRGVEGLLKKNQVEYLKGKASLKDGRTLILANGKTISAKHIIIATGSRSKSIAGFTIDEDTVLSSQGALSMTRLPQRIVILGAGAIGMEFAYIFSSFGVKVTVVEMAKEILPLEDTQMASFIKTHMSKKGITFATSTIARELKKGKNLSLLLESTYGKEKIVETDAVLVSVGRQPHIEDLGLEKLGVHTKQGCIVTDNYGKTSMDSVYAIGDVKSTAQLAHVASKEGEIAVEHIAGKKNIRIIDPDTIPSAIYCEPQLASFGPSEDALRKKTVKIKKFVFPYQALGKAVATSQTGGMIKLLCAEDTHEVIACHVVGYNATEVIHEVLLAKHSELLAEDLAGMIHAHPTISEAVMEAAKGMQEGAIHI